MKLNISLHQTEINFVKLPAKKIKIGSPVGELNRSESETEIFVILTEDFWISTTIVDINLWNFVMKEQFSTESKLEISWLQAIEFIQKLKLNYIHLIPSSFTFSLPTEAQWEYACTSGTGSIVIEEGVDFINKYGMVDMLGTDAVEWCLDVASYYPSEDGEITTVVNWFGDEHPELWFDDNNLKIWKGGIRSARRGYEVSDEERAAFRICLVKL